MATARVLPSGQWRCLVFDGMENGKRKYKSFTAATKNDAELQAKQYLADPSRKSRDRKLTVKDAIERYISSKEGVGAAGDGAGKTLVRGGGKNYCCNDEYSGYKKNRKKYVLEYHFNLQSVIFVYAQIWAYL